MSPFETPAPEARDNQGRAGGNRDAIHCYREGTMGRPTKHSEPLTEPYSFKLAKSEAVVLNDKISRSNMTNATFLRDIVLKNETVVIARPAASLEKKRMQFLFNKTSNNMNQIAHVLNGAQLAGKLSPALCENAIAQLEAIADYLKSALDHVD